MITAPSCSGVPGKKIVVSSRADMSASIRFPDLDVLLQTRIAFQHDQGAGALPRGTPPHSTTS